MRNTGRLPSTVHTETLDVIVVSGYECFGFRLRFGTVGWWDHEVVPGLRFLAQSRLPIRGERRDQREEHSYQQKHKRLQHHRRRHRRRHRRCRPLQQN